MEGILRNDRFSGFADMLYLTLLPYPRFIPIVVRYRDYSRECCCHLDLLL